MTSFNLSVLVVLTLLFTSCSKTNNNNEWLDDAVVLEELVGGYDLWYVDYHRTEGTADVPFISQSFTLSFFDGILYANNNLVDIGRTGNGLGLTVGYYDTRSGTLEVNHKIDGYYAFEVVQLSLNEIRLDFPGVSYYLIGYQRNTFDYDALFYDNIEYFLQEYTLWERLELKDGVQNIFDDERFLRFTSEDHNTFYASTAPFGTNVASINWDFIGRYTVYNLKGTNTLKELVLAYDDGGLESFELRVVEPNIIELYHPRSATHYTFIGKGFTYYLKSGSAQTAVKEKHTSRKRLKIKRQTRDKRF